MFKEDGRKEKFLEAGESKSFSHKRLYCPLCNKHVSIEKPEFSKTYFCKECDTALTE